MKILHIVTLIDQKGSYGGPATVARNFMKEINSLGGSCRILAGSLDEENRQVSVAMENIVMAKVYRFFPISSFAPLYSFKFFRISAKEISNVEVVHIHFSRDIIAILSGLLSLILRKKLILQTHGMIVRDHRILVRVFDFVITKPILKRSDLVLALSTEEKQKLEYFTSKTIEIVSNGVHNNAEKPSFKGDKRESIVTFIGRIAKVKNPMIFAEVCREFREKGFETKFLMYGPDGGELNNVLDYIAREGLDLNFKYMGSLEPHGVIEKLSQSNLNILPSTFENVPMVALESMSVGTPTLIMENNMLASDIGLLDKRLVCSVYDPKVIAEAAVEVLKISDQIEYREKLKNLVVSKYSLNKITKDYLARLDSL